MHCMIKKTFFFHNPYLYTCSLLRIILSHLVTIWCNQIKFDAIQFPVENTFTYFVHSLLILICSFIYKCILFHLNFNQFTENNCVNLLFSFMYIYVLYSHASNSDIMIKIKTWLNSCLLPITTNNILKFLWKSWALISGIKFTLHKVSNSDFHWVLPLSK